MVGTTQHEVLFITDGFILFLFVDDGNEGSSNLFCFLPIDIKEKWELKTYIGSKRNLKNKL